MIPDWASALVAKAKVAGLLGAALAAGGVGGSVALSHVTPASQQVVTSAAPTSSAPETADPTPDAEATQAQDQPTPAAQTATPAPCPSDVKNHGAYVSSVARSTAHGKGADHGATVSAAAKSDCGKPAQGAGRAQSATGGAQSGNDQSGEQESPDPESSAATHTHATPTHPSAPSGHGNGHTH